MERSYGKARVLRSRLKSYYTGYGSDWKSTSLLDAGDHIECIRTESELAAMLLDPPYSELSATI